jgi:hypothetical protein
MKVEKGGVHHNKYNDRCTKQWIRNPKSIWTSSILGRISTCRISFNRASLMKHDVNDEVPNGNPQLSFFQVGCYIGMACWS